MSSTLDWAEFAARDFEQTLTLTPGQRRWTTPGVMACEIERNTRQTAALDALDAVLVKLADGDLAKLMVFMPPQVGKSERAVRRFVEWLLDQFPELRIVVASFDYGTARRWGALIKQDIETYPELGITLRQDSKAAGYWSTAQGGSLYCVGIRGALTSRAVDLLIIDDPVKDRAAAESATQRDAAWDWWENVAKPRALRTLVIQTRWHQDDLSGRLLEREPGEWSVLSIPAVAEDADDPLGREPGVEMEPARERPDGYYSQLQKTTSPYVWSSLYQQRPTAAEGGIFKRGDWRYWQWGGTNDDRMIVTESGQFRLTECTRFATLDLATSVKTSADFTVACAWAITIAGDIVLLDRKRDRVPEVDHAAFLEPLRQRWLQRYDVTHIESRMFGTTLVYALGRAGVPVAELEADTDKLTRALPAAGLVRQHRVWLPADAAWLDEWLDEHADFPNVAHDDQVDNTGYAARVAIAHWLPMETAEHEHAREAAATPEPGFVDLETAAF
ncbi:phage terminase large subunit [uncultured Jatrophihabitans sp.]|uniref:phage terminase large subunit n=1 Tax=uncultured Jatrophihabitans sp. TaxID=1610747 RepID=UPI0035CB7C6D